MSKYFVRDIECALRCLPGEASVRIVLSGVPAVYGEF